MDSGTGKLLFSTKGCYSGGNVIIMIIVCFFGMLMVATQFSQQSLVYWGFLILFVIPLSNSQSMKRSYIDLYEGFITGQAIPESFWSNNNGAQFHLSYADIQNIEIQGKTVKIYFNGGAYVVQANGVEAQVVNIIQTQRSIAASKF